MPASEVRRNPIEEREQVTVDHTDLMESLMLDGIEHGDHAGGVDLDADHVDVGFGRGHPDRRLTVAESDVEDDVTVPPEHVDPLEHRSLDVQPPGLDPPVELGLAFRRQRSPPHLERRSRPPNRSSFWLQRFDHAVETIGRCSAALRADSLRDGGGDHDGSGR